MDVDNSDKEVIKHLIFKLKEANLSKTYVLSKEGLSAWDYSHLEYYIERYWK